MTIWQEGNGSQILLGEGPAIEATTVGGSTVACETEPPQLVTAPNMEYDIIPSIPVDMRSIRHSRQEGVGLVNV